MIDSAPSLDDGASDVTIVLADDHPVVRTGLRMLLDAADDMRVVAEAGDVGSAQRFVLGHKPTVLVLDLNMPGGSSLAAIPRIAEASPQTSVVVLTSRRTPPSHARHCRPELAATCSSTQRERSSYRRSAPPPAAVPG